MNQNTSHTSAAESRRLAELDGIRGLAALAVLLYHAFYIPLLQTDAAGLARLIAQVTKAGWLGVDLFFVLSGFLITGILLESRSDRHYLRNFYARRVLRIAPLYYAALLVLLLWYPDSGSFVLLGSLYLTNFASLFAVPMLFGPLWSLSVEEHFYLLWPWLVRWLSRRGLAITAALIVLVSPLARACAFGSVGVMEIYYLSWFRFDGLAWGALLALFYRSRFCTARNLNRAALAAMLSGAAIIVAGLPFGLLSRERFIGSVMLYTAAQLFFAGLMAAALQPQQSRLKSALAWRPLVWCGEISYCFYLVHVFCFHAVEWLLAQSGLNLANVIGTLGDVTVRAAIGTTLAFAIAALSWRYFESPILGLKRHFISPSAEGEVTEQTKTTKQTEPELNPA
ncbi:MAG TPA: acyltransferase [Blastocatellia bacterium]|nr:acyltransferase [Blastocatellia bacterium]